MAQPSINLLSSSMVVPASPSQQRTMFLSSIDILWRWFHYNQRILFYHLDSPIDYPALLHSLKSSLSLALVHFYPWAGRLFVQEDGRLALDCNDAGVEFVVASVDFPFSTLQEDGFQHKPFFKNLVPLGEHLKWDRPDLPLLSVQVTRFPDGDGIAVGLAQSHTIADGQSFWHFVKSWAECARGVPISVPPLHMRTALKPENLILPPQKNGHQSITAGKGFERKPPQGLVVELAERVFHFSGDMIKKLKAMSCEDGKGPFTSFEALSAHAWKHITAARAVSDTQELGFFVICDFRRRMVPPLPAAYFGNAIFREMITAKAGELRRESLASTAARIHEKIVSLDDTFFRTMLGKLEVLDLEEVQGPWKGRVATAVSSSPRFPVYQTDFGWGKPAAVRAGRVRGDGEMVLFGGREGGGSVDVCLALPGESMHRLQQDDHFLSF